MEYTFTLKYQLSEHDRDTDAIIERLGAAGCDDALLGVGVVGRIAMEFTREAGSAQEALVSALADVKAAIPSAKLIEAAPDLVGLTDVAEMIGTSRQNVRKLMVNHDTSFPAPVHEGSAVVWHLADVLAWLKTRGTYNIASGLAEVAEMARQINLAKAAPLLRPALQREVQALVA
jgi:predicted DNA-binding transcriptional regulator AlpA